MAISLSGRSAVRFSLSSSQEQTFVFFARSSTVLFHFPPLPRRFIYIPTILQCGLLVITSLEASRGFLEAIFGSLIISVIFLCIACEGTFGGYSYVSIFSLLGQAEVETNGQTRSEEDKAARREFRIACVGFADVRFVRSLMTKH